MNVRDVVFVSLEFGPCEFCGGAPGVGDTCCDQKFWQSRSCKRCGKPYAENARWGVEDLCACGDWAL